MGHTEKDDVGPGGSGQLWDGDGAVMAGQIAEDAEIDSGLDGCEASGLESGVSLGQKEWKKCPTLRQQ